MNREDRAAFEDMLREVRGRVDPKLAAFLAPRVSAARAVSTEASAAAAEVESLALRGGKRMRAALLGAGYVACGTDQDLAPVEGAMIAIELLQVYLLIHDDWMDDDAVRRGGPSVHVALRERLGDRALGDAAAVLAGDLASAYAQEALLETPLPADRVLRAAKAHARVQQEVVLGQLGDIHPAERDAGAPDLETVHTLKTASYTVTGPLAIGACLAGANDARVAELARFGRALGVAFQLADDLLGVFGDPGTTGKPVLSDLRRGKRTALVAEMRGDPLLARVLGKKDARQEDLEAVARAMETCGARARVETRLRDLLAEARRALDALPFLSPAGKRMLASAVGVLGERTS